MLSAHGAWLAHASSEEVLPEWPLLAADPHPAQRAGRRLRAFHPGRGPLLEFPASQGGEREKEKEEGERRGDVKGARSEARVRLQGDAMFHQCSRSHFCRNLICDLLQFACMHLLQIQTDFTVLTKPSNRPFRRTVQDCHSAGVQCMRVSPSLVSKHCVYSAHSLFIQLARQQTRSEIVV